MKLVSNSTYGKMIMKSSFVRTEVRATDTKQKLMDTHQWSCNQSASIKGWYTTPHNWFVTRYTDDDTSTYCLYGSHVLAQSRVIMNRVWEACERAQCYIYYTDTDSIMIEHDKIQEVKRQYEAQRIVDAASGYHYPELDGEQQQQFNTDFQDKAFAYYPDGDMDNKVSTWPKGVREKDIYSNGMYCVRKKCYMHTVAIDYKDEKNQPQVARGLVFKMKGQPSSSVVYHAHNLPTNPDYSGLHPEYKHQSHRGLITLFQDIINGKEHKIVINPKGKSKFYHMSGCVFTDEAPVCRTIITRGAAEQKKTTSRKRKSNMATKTTTKRICVEIN